MEAPTLAIKENDWHGVPPKNALCSTFYPHNFWYASFIHLLFKTLVHPTSQPLNQKPPFASAPPEQCNCVGLRGLHLTVTYASGKSGSPNGCSHCQAHYFDHNALSFATVRNMACGLRNAGLSRLCRLAFCLIHLHQQRSTWFNKNTLMWLDHKKSVWFHV